MEDRLSIIKLQYKLGTMSIVDISWLIETVAKQQEEIKKLQREKDFWEKTAAEFRTVSYALLSQTQK